MLNEHLVGTRSLSVNHPVTLQEEPWLSYEEAWLFSLISYMGKLRNVKQLVYGISLEQRVKIKLHDHHPNPKCWTINTWLLLSIFLGWLHLHPSAPTLNLLSHCISFSSRISFSSVTPTSEHTHVTFYGMNHLWALSSPARNLPKDRDLYQFCSLI